jgi:hypothetical protein
MSYAWRMGSIEDKISRDSKPRKWQPVQSYCLGLKPKLKTGSKGHGSIRVTRNEPA